MESDDRKFWFPAKVSGFGWSLPCCWQGWLVLIGYLILVLGGLYLIGPSSHRGLCYGYFIGLTVLLIVIAWVKGEKLS